MVFIGLLKRIKLFLPTTDFYEINIIDIEEPVI
jgi:hypothetical protein